MKYENPCPTCGEVRIMRQKTSRICSSCARTLVWEIRRLAALSDLVRRSRDHVAILQGMVKHSGPYLMQAQILTEIDRDVAALANDVMIAQLAIAEKGVAA